MKIEVTKRRVLRWFANGKSYGIGRKAEGRSQRTASVAFASLGSSLRLVLLKDKPRR